MSQAVTAACSVEAIEGGLEAAPGDGEERVRVAASALPAEGVAATVLLVPWGEVRSSQGTFVLDESAGAMILRAFEGHGTDLPVDYEHQSLGGMYSSPSGQAPAAGWVRALRLVVPGAEVEPGLYGEVEWTEAAAARLAAKEYRYLSPVVVVRKADRRVVSLHSAALTNKPAIVGMRPIVNRDEAAGEAVGMANDVVAACEEREMEDAMAVVLDEPGVLIALRERLGLAADADAAAVLAAAESRLAELMREADERRASERAAAAMRAGKLTSAQRGWAMSLAMRDPGGFEQWLASAPVVVALGRTDKPGGAAGCGRDRHVVIAAARTAFRAEPALALLTSEQAWLDEALRDAGLGEK